ncbi:hypothetical protein [Streptomyces sp. NPDC020681]|uniref:hypothetical protein n=1 Tax=Streptomyces sp. NPDC020681 TaxID=3365083 RepID=UPI0037AE11AC
MTLPSTEVKPFHLSNASFTNLTVSRHLAQAAGYDWPDAPSASVPTKAGTGVESATEIGTSVASGNGTIAFVAMHHAKPMSAKPAKLDTRARGTHRSQPRISGKDRGSGPRGG